MGWMLELAGSFPMAESSCELQGPCHEGCEGLRKMSRDWEWLRHGSEAESIERQDEAQALGCTGWCRGFGSGSWGWLALSTLLEALQSPPGSLLPQQHATHSSIHQ